MRPLISSKLLGRSGSGGSGEGLLRGVSEAEREADEEWRRGVAEANREAAEVKPGRRLGEGSNGGFEASAEGEGSIKE